MREWCSADLDQPDRQCNTNAQNRRLAGRLGNDFYRAEFFLSEISSKCLIITGAHCRGLDMYQVGVSITTSSCLTTKPNLL